MNAKTLLEYNGPSIEYSCFMLTSEWYDVHE